MKLSNISILQFGAILKELGFDLDGLVYTKKGLIDPFLLAKQLFEFNVTTSLNAKVRHPNVEGAILYIRPKTSTWYKVYYKEDDTCIELITETAARTQESIAFLYLCGAIAQPRLYDEDPPPQLLSAIQEYLEDAEPFILKHKLLTPTQIKKARKLNKNNFWDLEYDLFVDDEQSAMSWRYYRSKTAKVAPDLTKQETTFLNYWSQFMRNDGSPTGQKAGERIKLIIGKLLPDLAKFYKGSINTSNTETLRKQLNQVIRDITGKAQDILTLDQAKKAREEDPIAFAKYSALRRQFNTSVNEVLVNLYRENGRMKIRDVLKQLKALNIQTNLVPAFNGLVDEQGFYTIYGEKLNGKPTGNIQMNPEYKKGSTVYVLKYQVEGAKTFQSLYTEKTVKDNRAEKFDKVGKSIGVIEKARKRWLKDLMQDDERAILTEMLFLTSARVGNTGNETDGVKTYGLTTILKKHVRIKGKELHIRYPGKKAQKQYHIIKADNKYSKNILEYVESVIEDLKPSDQIFDVTGREISAYLKTLGLSITAHKFRTLHGTLLMNDLLNQAKEDLPKKPQDKTVIQTFNKCLLEVGALLGHFNKEKLTGTTALKNYINPSIMVAFFDHYGVQLPSNLQALL